MRRPNEKKYTFEKYGKNNNNWCVESLRGDKVKLKASPQTEKTFFRATLFRETFNVSPRSPLRSFISKKKKKITKNLLLRNIYIAILTVILNQHKEM